jgi:hypothetical protein
MQQGIDDGQDVRVLGIQRFDGSISEKFITADAAEDLDAAGARALALALLAAADELGCSHD